MSASELAPLVDATRPPDEVDTASLAGAELDAMLSTERTQSKPEAPPPPPQTVIATNTRSAQAAAVFTTTGERPAVMPTAADRTVVVAPELLAAPMPSVPPVAANVHMPVAAQDPGAIPIAPPLSIPLKPASKFTGLWFTLGGLALLGAAVAGVMYTLKRDQNRSESNTETPATAAPSASMVATAPTPKSAPVASSAAPSKSTESAPAAESAEAEARAALTKMRDGIGTCVRDVIGVLPGSSPPIPERFATLKKRPYQSVPRDYRSPVFACTRYKEAGPQHFQIQWQLLSPPGEGRGVAWIDDNGDGKPDRAFGFRAALLKKNEVDLGEIGPIDPVPAPVKTAP
ncbi:MAG: hypothetical protein IPK82_08645 [Polyangiaceae bacterium]|nr:hypothetical protein [Polyangiaceae bacterium]